MHTNRRAQWTHPGALIVGVIFPIILALLVAPGGSASAQGVNEVPLRAGTISTEEVTSGLLVIERLGRDRAARVDAFDAQQAPERIIIQFETTPTNAERRELELQGIHLLGFIGNGAYFATVESLGIANLRSASERDRMPEVRGVAPVLPDYKLEESLQDQAVGEWAVEADGTLRLRVTLWPDASLDAAIGVVEQIAEVLEVLPEFDAFVIRVAPEDVRSITEYNDVQWIEPVPPPFDTFNDEVRRRLSVAGLGQAGTVPGATGIAVGVWDGGLVDGHDDFTGRITVLEPSASVSNHATHVAGTLGGSGAASAGFGGEDEQWRGVAAAVHIFTADFYGDVPSEMIQAIDAHDLHLTTNSWGYRVEQFPLGNCHLYGSYETISRDFDAIIVGSDDRPGIPILFAAGNERNDEDCGMSSTPPFENYGVITPPATAKNVITVGAVNSDDDSMTEFSSWGPVQDGRLKPEVVAPGCKAGGDGAVTSTIRGNRYDGKCGTSMATPAVAGVVALMIEEFIASHGARPLPATVKAVLISSAVDLGTAGPDFRHGYGRIDAHAAVETVRTQRIVERTIEETGEVDTTSVEILSGTPSLSVTLAWDDVPGTPGSASTLVNDLDLVVLDPTGGRHLPLVLNPSEPTSAAVPGVDSRNVVEQVRADAPGPGTWTVEVHGTRIAQGNQSFALVVNVGVSEEPGADVLGELDELRAVLEERVRMLEEGLGPSLYALEQDAYAAASGSIGVTAFDVVALGRTALGLERELHAEQALLLEAEERLRDLEEEALEMAAANLGNGDAGAALALLRVTQLISLAKSQVASLWQQNATIDQKLALARGRLLNAPSDDAGSGTESTAAY